MERNISSEIYILLLCNTAFKEHPTQSLQHMPQGLVIIYWQCIYQINNQFVYRLQKKRKSETEIRDGRAEAKQIYVKKGNVFKVRPWKKIVNKSA